MFNFRKKEKEKRPWILISIKFSRCGSINSAAIYSLFSESRYEIGKEIDWREGGRERREEHSEEEKEGNKLERKKEGR